MTRKGVSLLDVPSPSYTRWGNWHLCVKDGTLNLIPEGTKNRTNYTFEDLFYWVEIKEISSYQDIFFWVTHMSHKNDELYGRTCSADLLKAFERILNTAKSEGFFKSKVWGRYPQEHTWEGEKLAKFYCAYAKKKTQRSIPVRLRVDILERDNYTCQMCGAKAPDVKLEIDHKTPRAKGGTNDPENLQVLCKDCNIGKSDRIIRLPE
jgi:hypothetical protein